MGRTPNKPVEVFEYIDMPDDGNPEPCWPWQGGLSGREGDKRGYFTVAGVKWLAYRLVYVLTYGDLGETDKVRHKCDNPICCNPYHLEKGSQSDNENDKYERDRYGFPTRVIESILEWDKKGIPQSAIGSIVTERYGIIVSQQRVSDIINGVRRRRQSEKINQRLSKE